MSTGESAQSDALQEVGRGISRLHMKIAAIQQRLDCGVSSGGSEPTQLETLFDLIEAIDSALERRRSVRGWFGRRSREEDLWRGLAVAVAAARERLEREGIEAAPTDGEFDPELHRVIEVLPVSAGVERGTIAATHRRGWIRRQGGERVVLRTAQVSVRGGEQ